MVRRRRRNCQRRARIVRRQCRQQRIQFVKLPREQHHVGQVALVLRRQVCVLVLVLINQCAIHRHRRRQIRARSIADAARIELIQNRQVKPRIVVVRIQLVRLLIGRNRSRQVVASAEAHSKAVMLQRPAVGSERGRRLRIELRRLQRLRMRLIPNARLQQQPRQPHMVQRLRRMRYDQRAVGVQRRADVSIRKRLGSALIEEDPRVLALAELHHRGAHRQRLLRG